MKKTMIIDIIGKRWFQKSYGNTYFSSKVYIDGHLVAELSKQYGYDDHYIFESHKVLSELTHGVVPDPKKVALWRYCRENNVILNTSVVDVTRQRDL